MQQYLTIGATGWEHPQWQDVYYPDGLPEDWRLGYYSNQYHAVLLPQSHWLACYGQPMRAWLQEVSPDFRFFLSFDIASPELQALQQARAILQEQLAGVVMQNTQSSRDIAHPIPLPELGRLLENLPVYNDTGVPAAGVVDCWRPGREMSDASAVGIVHGTDIPDLRAMRSHMQHFIQQAPAVRDLYLFIDGEPPPAQLLSDAVTVAELLGY